MASLLILRLVRPEDEAAPEFRYSFDSLVAEARGVFGSIEVLRLAADGVAPPALPAGFETVLLVGPANVLVRRASLEAMRRRLEEGVAVVIPVPLTAAVPQPDPPLYSLRDFDDLEAGWLAGSAPGPHPASRRAVPLSLWRPEEFERILRDGAWSRLLDAEAEMPLPSEATVRAGLYHQYADYYGEVRSDVLPFVPEGTKEVLDVGCGRGVTGRFLRENLGCRVTGVELNPEVAREAEANLHAVIQGNVAGLSDLEMPEMNGAFDVVLALELFEHLETPEEFLRKARNWVRPGGRIILSIPNVGHYSVVEDLLAGRWDYLPIGLLCYTHLRFFTRRTLEDWLRRCGFARFEITAQHTELPQRIRALAETVDGSPSGVLTVDEESLRTKGFFVVVHWP